VHQQACTKLDLRGEEEDSTFHHQRSPFQVN